jgi:hypothetical protein
MRRSRRDWPVVLEWAVLAAGDAIVDALEADSDGDGAADVGAFVLDWMAREARSTRSRVDDLVVRGVRRWAQSNPGALERLWAAVRPRIEARRASSAPPPPPPSPVPVELEAEE